MRPSTLAALTAFASLLVVTGGVGSAYADRGASNGTAGQVGHRDHDQPNDRARAQDRAHSRRADIVIRGHGYGHGHGMSQYGAQGAALQGKSYRQIVDFYFPGTSWDRLQGRIRVLITADTTSEVIVSAARGLSVRDRHTGDIFPLPTDAGVKRWRLGLSGGHTVIEKLTSQWRSFNPTGKSTGELKGVGEFFADRPMTLWFPNGSTKTYRGILRAAPPYDGAKSLDTVNALSMDDYLQGVVPYEMPASWDSDAVKAQAIAARTYATWSRNQNRSRYYQICDTTACQVYGGVDGEDSRSNAAVVATTREILTYHGKAAFTQFSSSSGGWTASGGLPYLPAKQDPYDGWKGNSMHDWSTTVSASSLERKYPKLGTLRQVSVVDRAGGGEWGGRANKVVLDGTRGNVTMSGDSFRWTAGLRSTWFKFD